MVVLPVVPMTMLPSEPLQPNAIRIPQVGYHPTRSVVAIALGSNLGNPRHHLLAGLSHLQQQSDVTILQISPCFWTEPVYWETSSREIAPAYLNGAALISTSLSPHQLMPVLLDIEHRQGRMRQQRWESRTLDLDILLWEQSCLQSPEVTIPHPRMTERAFVLFPLQTVIPHWIVPGFNRTVAQLADQVGISGVNVNTPVHLTLTSDDLPSR